MHINTDSFQTLQKLISQDTQQSSESKTTEALSVEGAVKTKNEAKTGNDDKITISPEGLRKQETETNEINKKNSNNIIEQLKERIKEVKQQLEALEGDTSPSAEDQRKMLNEQLAMLSAALLKAMDIQNAQ